MDLTDKVIVITGASRGLGAALAQVSLSAGARVGVCSRGEPVVRDPERVVAMRLSVDDAAAVERFGERVRQAFGHVDLWINNAGLLGPVGPLRDADPALLAQATAVNISGVLFGSRIYARLCRSAGRHGVLLNLSSGAARRPYAGWSAYCAGKAAVDRLSEVVALEERGHLRVHSVAPGVFESAMQAQLRSYPPEVFPEVGKFQRLHHGGVLLSPQVVAGRLLALAFSPVPGPKMDQVCLDLRDYFP